MKRPITTKRLPSRRVAAKHKPKVRSCPVRALIECLQFPPIPKLPNQAGMTPEQMAEAGVHPNQTLYWCSECESVWLETEYHFARILGKQETWGSPFVPNKSKTDSRYIG